MRETLYQFVELLNLTPKQEKQLLILFNTEKDVQYFEDEILNKVKDICNVDVLMEKMREYKIKTCPMDLNMFLCIYNEEPVKAIQKLFRHNIEENEIQMLKEVMKQIC
ncbi:MULTISPECIES: hypothetical protein [Bacillus]|uniref:hypothetical protein n=1 Tax=Bacillus TaxID=1386 RepID=UPI001C036AAD|nr:hypothetical protein [Bacillus mycoides]QWG82632.1 hypothetical protein EXW61_03700 [Bacillus mycoides]